METPAAPFVPPRCPRTSCRYHTCPTGWRYIRFGYYRRQCAPRVIARFRCCHCRSTFSTQSFSTTYYLKRPELQLPIAHRLQACSGYRQIAREARCAPSTVMGQAARIGRHALLVLEEHRAREPIREPLVIDGFENFAYSQFQPLHVHLVVGAESHYVYGFTISHLRRKGAMTEAQKKKRAALETCHGRPDPKAVELDMAAALLLALPGPQELTVHSDEHPAYPRALKRLKGCTIQHTCTPSVQARVPSNPLFPVNLMDLLLRHNSACHKRETIAFGKRHQAVLERAALLVMWRNLSKSFSENHGGGTPAMRRGVRKGPLSMKALFAERKFPAVTGLRGPWEKYYRREIDTVGIAKPRRHALKLAF